MLKVSYNFEVLNGIIGMMRDLICLLLRKMYWKDDEDVRNLIGISGDCFLLIKHYLFAFVRCDPCMKIELPDIIVYNKYGCFTVDESYIEFNLQSLFDKRTAIFKPHLKNMLVECSIKNFLCDFGRVNFGVLSTNSNFDEAMKNPVGWYNFGASVEMEGKIWHLSCNGSYSKNIHHDDPVSKLDTITLFIDTRKKRQCVHIMKNKKMIPCCIVNLSEEGVHVAISTYNFNPIISVLSFRKLLHHPPSPSTCLTFDFNGKFQNLCEKVKDEEGVMIYNTDMYFDD